MEGGGRALGIVQRSAPLRSGSTTIGELARGEVTERAVRANVVVVVFPCTQCGTCLSQRGEERLIEEFVAQASVDGEDGPAPSAPALCWRYRYLTGAIIMEP